MKIRYELANVRIDQGPNRIKVRTDHGWNHIKLKLDS